MSYSRPRDENNYRKHIKLEDNRALVYCVECEFWHQVSLQASAEIEIRAWMKRPQIMEIKPDTIILTCGECGVSIEYLVRDFRVMVIKHILSYMPGGEAAPITMKPKPKMIQRRFEHV